MTFYDLEISEPILKALNRKSYKEPTPIQGQAIPVALSGRDLFGVAQTGTGKTAAFAIPIIQSVHQNRSRDKRRTISALVLAPTRELALQVSDSFRDYSQFTGLRYAVVYGGVKQGPQVNRIKKGVDVLIATPGRLLDLVGQGHISLNNVKHFVLDEADCMLDMGFIHDIRRVTSLLPKKRQTLFFSATNPAAIRKLSASILHNPVRVEVAPSATIAETIEQKLYLVNPSKKRELLTSLLAEEKNRSTLVFSRTRRGADRLAKSLKSRGIGCESIHGEKTQGARQRTLNNFKSGKTNIIIATDVASRGLDIANLELVINYDLPDVPETYVHRIGRTGRAGNSGTAITFYTHNEKRMIRDIQKLTGTKFDRIAM